jgi:hypothetical protein
MNNTNTDHTTYWILEIKLNKKNTIKANKNLVDSYR